MKSSFYPLLTLVLAMSVSGCKKDFSCKQLQKGEWAIAVSDDIGQDGDCPYEGQAVLDGEVHELVCEVSGKECVCRAGHEFGIYEVTFTNLETGETDFAVQEVEAAPEPDCILRDRLDRDPPKGLGGNGGAGGSDS